MKKMIIRAYLRASTIEQDEMRAKQMLIDFIAKYEGCRITTFYSENKSGTLLNRPELMRLISESGKGDIILVESVDRLTRMPPKGWEELKMEIRKKGLVLVVVDMPTTHTQLTGGFDTRMGEIFNNMFLDIYADFAYHDWEKRKIRQEQGIKKAKALGKYKGRSSNLKKHNLLIQLLAKNTRIEDAAQIVGFSNRHCRRLREHYKDEIDIMREE